MELNINIKFDNKDLIILADKDNIELLSTALSLLSNLATPSKVNVVAETKTEPVKTKTEPVKTESPTVMDRKSIEKEIKSIMLEKKPQMPMFKEIVKSYGVGKLSELTDENLAEVLEKAKTI